MESLTVGQAAARTGWSPRMLRYLERAGLVIPSRSASGYRQYGLLELNQLRSLNELRRRFGVGIDDLAFMDAAVRPRLGAAQARAATRRLNLRRKDRMATTKRHDVKDLSLAPEGV